MKTCPNYPKGSVWRKWPRLWSMLLLSFTWRTTSVCIEEPWVSLWQILAACVCVCVFSFSCLLRCKVLHLRVCLESMHTWSTANKRTVTCCHSRSSLDHGKTVAICMSLLKVWYHVLKKAVQFMCTICERNMKYVGTAKTMWLRWSTHTGRSGYDSFYTQLVQELLGIVCN